MGGGSGDADDVDDALAASLSLPIGLRNGRGGRDLMRGRALHSSQEKGSKFPSSVW